MKWRHSCRSSHMPKSRISVLNLASSILSWWERRILMLQLLLNLYCHVEMNLKSVKIVFLWNQGKLLGNENIFGPILFYEVATHCLHPWFLEWEWLSSVDLLTPREKSFSILKKQLPLLILLNATRKVYKAVKVHLSYELERNPVTFNILIIWKNWIAQIACFTAACFFVWENLVPNILEQKLYAFLIWVNYLGAWILT